MLCDQIRIFLPNISCHDTTRSIQCHQGTVLLSRSGCMVDLDRVTLWFLGTSYQTFSSRSSCYLVKWSVRLLQSLVQAVFLVSVSHWTLKRFLDSYVLLNNCAMIETQEYFKQNYMYVCVCMCVSVCLSVCAANDQSIQLN